MVLLVGLALLLRLAYVSLLHATPAGRYLLIDSAFYDARAAQIAAGRGFGPGPYFMNPGYPYLLAPLYALGAGGLPGVGIVQSLAGTLAVFGIGLLARRWFDTRVGLWAMGLAALYGPFWFYDGAILTASPIVCGSVLLLLALERLRDRPGVWLAVAAGGIAGGVALLRPTILLFVAALPWLLSGGSGEDAKRVRRLGFLVWIATAAAIAPATIRNLVIVGEPVLLSTSLGMNFYTGNHAGATGVYAGAPFVSSYEPEFERADFRREAERRSGRPLTDAETSHFWLGEGVRAIVTDPGAAVRRELDKLLLAFHHVESQNNLSLDFVRDLVPLLRWNPFGFRLLAPLGLAGLVLLLKSGRPRPAFMAIGFAACHLAAMLIFFVSSEYRLPMVVVFIPAAAAFIVTAIDRLRGRRPPLPRAVWLVLVLGVVLANRETDLTRGLASKRVDYLNFATLAEAHGDETQALALLDQALAIDPHFAPALRRQAALARRLGLGEQAAASEAALAALPPAPETEITLWDVDRAVSLYRSKRYAEALAVFTQLASGRPEDPRLLNNIGLCLYKLGRLREAEAVLRRAVVRDPHYARAIYNLGLVFEAEGRLTEAEATWQAVLAEEPGNRRARERLARLVEQGSAGAPSKDIQEESGEN